ncbi:hypothetical protein [Rhizobium sp. 11_C7_N12_5]|uniref:hypothetical protein n=1 Tax=Rhizobium sp. 11_C7_N12_5 TaxID=3240770 RepID=UPI003F25E691
MKNGNTTAHAPGATLTESELFEEYANGSVTYGSKRGRHTIEVADLFTGYGETERFTDAMLATFEDILEDDDPSHMLEALTRTLEGMLADVKIASKGFEEFKADRWIEVEDDEPQRYSAASVTIAEAA